MKMYATDIRYSNESSCVLSGVGCTSAEEGNVEWPALHSCHATMYPCVKYHPFFKGGSVVRECSSQDELLRVDFSNCSVLQSDFSTPFAVVWFTFAGTIGSTVPLSALSAIRRDVRKPDTFTHCSIYVTLLVENSMCLWEYEYIWRSKWYTPMHTKPCTLCWTAADYCFHTHIT